MLHSSGDLDLKSFCGQHLPLLDYAFIHDPDLRWSFFLENIVFYSSQGGAIRHIGIFVRPMVFFGMNLLAHHPMFTASFRLKDKLMPDKYLI